jgi:deoxyribodipyrimidine photo-lyase
MKAPVIVWFRRDLRVHDQAALVHASRTGAPVLPLFIFDRKLIASLPYDGAVFDFQAEALHELSRKIAFLGGNLIVRSGNLLDIHRVLIREIQPAALYYNKDYEPYAIECDVQVNALYHSFQIEVHTCTDSVIHEPEEVLTKEGKPYVVFSPYARAWKKLPIPSTFGQPKRFTTPNIHVGSILGSHLLKKEVFIDTPMFHGGESIARELWKEFLSRRLNDYETNRNYPAQDGTSRMSPYLRFGCISIREMFENLGELNDRAKKGWRKKSIKKFIDELIWREFYHAALFHLPRLVDTNYKQQFDKIRWVYDRKQFESWKSGHTGFPLIDAGMRQLKTTGWMHNRVRMVVASFLTKDLLHDWKSGARYFEEKLMDIDTASNIGGWQWSASTGIDPKPMRIFNPRLQAEKYDPQGEYIKRWIPELQAVPAKYIHAPHEMSFALQKEIGCIMGKHYPRPIVDHAQAAALYKKIFYRIKN